MPRIPIFTSRRTISQPRLTLPPASMGTEVSEAIGGLARTVGKVAEDWATAKANTEKQSEYVSNTISYKEAQAEFLKERQDDPNYLDDKELLSAYETKMEKVKNSLTWKYASTKKQFGSTSQLSDSAFMQKSYNLNRRKFIDSKIAEGETKTQRALRLRSKPLLEQNIASLQNVYSKEELKVKENKDYYDLEMLQAGDKLKIDPNADLSEHDLLDKDKAGLIREARTKKHNEQIILKREKAERQAQTQADLQVRAVDEAIPVEELKSLRSKQEISGGFFNAMMSKHNSKPVFNSGVYAGYLMEIYEPTGKYKEKADFINAITKSFHIDGQLDKPSTKELIKMVMTPPTKSQINDFARAKAYFKGKKYLDEDTQDYLLRLLDKEMREDPELKGKAILDRAKEMVDPIRAENENAWYKIFFDEKVRVLQLKRERGEFEETLRRKVEASKKSKETFNPEGTGYDTETAAEAGLESKEGHLPSLDPRTGMVLKARKHPTWDLMVDEETKLGNKIVKKAGRYYSVPKAEAISKAGKVRVKAPDGKEYWLPEAELEEAKKAGYKVVE